MKTLKTWLGGAITITEQSGSLYLNFNESIGGGAASGIIKGQGSFCLGAAQALQAGETDLNKLIPSTWLPVVELIEGVANQAATALE